MAKEITITAVTELLTGFSPISMKETSSIQLMDRYDTKYTFPFISLSQILDSCKEDYKLTTESDTGLFPYETWYYDTPQKELYLSHHNGKGHRYKFRIRSYNKFNLIFAEVKEKFKGKTIKQRVPFRGYSGIAAVLEDPEAILKIEELIKRCTPYSFLDFTLAIKIDFHRITLVHTNREERITIDTLLTYQDGEKTLKIPELVIAEIKHQGPVPHLGFSQILKHNQIHAGSFSKYCLGMASLDPSLKYNRFKSQLMNIERLAYVTGNN